MSIGEFKKLVEKKKITPFYQATSFVVTTEDVAKILDEAGNEFWDAFSIPYGPGRDTKLRELVLKWFGA